jgi:hypothetical protein
MIAVRILAGVNLDSIFAQPINSRIRTGPRECRKPGPLGAGSWLRNINAAARPVKSNSIRAWDCRQTLMLPSYTGLIPDATIALEVSNAVWTRSNCGHRRMVAEPQFQDRYREQQAMSCTSCGSENLGKFRGEIAIQSFWLEIPDETPVFLWPELAVCLDCGVARFAVPARDMRMLAAKATAAAAA